MRYASFKIRGIIFLYLLSLLFIFTLATFAEDSLPDRDTLFTTVEENMKIAREKQSERYAPKTFKQALKGVKKAEALYQKNKKKAEIEKTIQNANKQFLKAIEVAEAALVFFEKVILSRADAEQGNGPTLDPGNWQKAEKKFNSAAQLFESGYTSDSKKKAKEAEGFYRKVELMAIQSKFLKETWSLIERTRNIGVKKYAPVTLNKAEAFAAKSASLLELNRYEQEDAAQLAKQAEYEAEHSIYLSRKVKKLKDNDHTFETVLLEMEKPLQKITVCLDIPAEFNKGFDLPTHNIIVAINTLKDENTRLAGVLESQRKELLQITDKKNYEIDGLQEQIQLLERQLSSLASTREKLEFKIKQQQIQEEKFARIRALFSEEEGQTFIEGKNVIIRLYGLNFPSGKSILEPQYFGLLSKVKSAFAEFPNSMIFIEGHTDAIGSDEINQKLSEDRAQAVRQYVIANSNISWDRIKAVGYGESRPVASNETAVGQEKNRRIDVRIQTRIRTDTAKPIPKKTKE